MSRGSYLEQQPWKTAPSVRVATPTDFTQDKADGLLGRAQAAWDVFAQLTKFRLSSLVVVTTAAGAFFAFIHRPDLGMIWHAAFGTALVACGASALNQVVERAVDARMQRTARRPIPGGRIRPLAALAVGVGLAIAGMMYLAVFANLLSSVLSALTLSLYIFVYTPMKRMTPLCTLVGAIPGAVPPVIGWAAVRGELGFEAWMLFSLLFLWQLPHFLAIAWVYREDYANAGLRMLSVVDPGGHLVGRQIVLYSAALLPVSLVPSLYRLAGPVYCVGAFLLGVAMLVCGLLMTLRSPERHAMRMFAASIAYLPLLFVCMAIDRILFW